MKTAQKANLLIVKFCCHWRMPSSWSSLDWAPQLYCRYMCVKTNMVWQSCFQRLLWSGFMFPGSSMAYHLFLWWLIWLGVHVFIDSHGLAFVLPVTHVAWQSCFQWPMWPDICVSSDSQCQTIVFGMTLFSRSCYKESHHSNRATAFSLWFVVGTPNTIEYPTVHLLLSI